MKLGYGQYRDVNGPLGPVRMIGLYKDVLYDGRPYTVNARYIYALVMWKWYVGIII